MRLPEGLILDVTPGPDASFETEILEQLGHPVLVCHGPDHGEACPVLKGHCDKLDAAHGVVFSLNLDRPMHRAILRRYFAVLGDGVPIQVVVHPGQDEAYADLLHGAKVWTHRPSADDIIHFAEAVEAADKVRDGAA